MVKPGMLASPAAAADAHPVVNRIFAHEGEVTARHAGDQLVIQLANQRRSYLLPRFLAYYTLGDARVRNGWLRARFAQPA